MYGPIKASQVILNDNPVPDPCVLAECKLDPEFLLSPAIPSGDAYSNLGW